MWQKLVLIYIYSSLCFFEIYKYSRGPTATKIPRSVDFQTLPTLLNKKIKASNSPASQLTSHTIYNASTRVMQLESSSILSSWTWPLVLRIKIKAVRYGTRGERFHDYTCPRYATVWWIYARLRILVLFFFSICSSKC